MMYNSTIVRCNNLLWFNKEISNEAEAVKLKEIKHQIVIASVIM